MAAAIVDVRSREIPDSLTVSLLGLALVATGLHLHRVAWSDLALGILLGFSAGVLFFQLGGLGGGDVKLLTGLGAVLGFRGELGLLFYTAIVGGLLALVARTRRKRDYAFAPAIALGLLAFIVRGYLP